MPGIDLNKPVCKLPEPRCPQPVQQNTSLFPCCEGLKAKMQTIWNRFVELIHIRPRSVNQQIPLEPIKPETQAGAVIDPELRKIRQSKTENKEKPVVIQQLREAFSKSMEAIKTAGLDSTALPRNIALQMTEIIGRFGIEIYAQEGEDEEAINSFRRPLAVLQAAIQMQEYALGLNENCPDLSQLESIDSLYQEPVHSQQADQMIANLDAAKWAEKVASLDQKQLLLLPNILRYANGAMRYIAHYEKIAQDLDVSEKLLKTAEACLLKGLGNPALDQVEVKNELAELKYNDVTGLLYGQMEQAEQNGDTTKAEEIKSQLEALWDECVGLSKEPAKMLARCINKRCFTEKLPPEKELELRKMALEKHLALPKEQQDPVLIALAHHNLSHVLYHKFGNIIEAMKHTEEAMKIVVDSRQKGNNNVQFTDVQKHSDFLVEEAKKIEEAVKSANII